MIESGTGIKLISESVADAVEENGLQRYTQREGPHSLSIRAGSRGARIYRVSRPLQRHGKIRFHSVGSGSLRHGACAQGQAHSRMGCCRLQVAAPFLHDHDSLLLGTGVSNGSNQRQRPHHTAHMTWRMKSAAPSSHCALGCKTGLNSLPRKCRSICTPCPSTPCLRSGLVVLRPCAYGDSLRPCRTRCTRAGMLL